MDDRSVSVQRRQRPSGTALDDLALTAQPIREHRKFNAGRPTAPSDRLHSPDTLLNRSRHSLTMRDHVPMARMIVSAIVLSFPIPSIKFAGCANTAETMAWMACHSGAHARKADSN